MIIGIPRERKEQEYRVSLTPDKVGMLVREGHTVLVESGAGEGAGFPDEDYSKAGGRIVKDEAEVFGQAELVVKVKEPQPEEYELLQEGQVLFTYLHLAAYPEVAHAIFRSGVTAIAYETVQLPDGRLPLLAPMSEIAGRMAPLMGVYYLQRPRGGRGKLVSGVPGVPPCHIVVLGGGTAGSNAARIAIGLGARVTIIEKNPQRLRELELAYRGTVETLYSTHMGIAESVTQADIIIGAVLIPGARAPRLVTREMVSSMRPGSVIVDIAVDQGGCVETSRPTSHTDPVYAVAGVLHYTVDNMPGAYPQTSSYALSNATFPYVSSLARLGFRRAVEADPALAKGVNAYKGMVTYPAVAEALGLPYTPLQEALQRG